LAAYGLEQGFVVRIGVFVVMDKGQRMSNIPQTTDVIVIGSGIGGLSCAALLAKYGYQVLVLESHSIPGGAAHGFERQGFKFDSGPSLYSGLTGTSLSNPLRQVLTAIEQPLDCVTYDSWDCHLPEGCFPAQVGSAPFLEILRQLRGEGAVAEWQQLQTVMEPLGRIVTTLPMAAFRFDLGAMLTTGHFMPKLLPYLGNLPQLLGPFSQVMDRVVKDPFIRNWLDLLCFLLSGLPAQGTSAAEMAFMFADWYRPGVVLDYPIGGSAALVNALVKGLQAYGGQLQLSAHVQQILVDEGRATGVKLRSGDTIQAKKAVISAISTWDLLPLLPPEAVPKRYCQQSAQIPACPSFMHLHLGIDGQGLRADLPCHAIVVNDWQRGVDAPQNVVVVSMPSAVDSSLAPAGQHVIHAYTPATEPYQLWQGLDRHGPEYAALKQERSQVLWQAIERVIPDVRDRAQVTLVGTPLTHERFLRRHRGSYGPALAAGESWFPGPSTPLPGLLTCGDSTFPGIGLPAVAASGMIAAHSLVSVPQHLQLLREIQLI
jgi:phytoene dehydrogenase-like protein